MSAPSEQARGLVGAVQRAVMLSMSAYVNEATFSLLGYLSRLEAVADAARELQDRRIKHGREARTENALYEALAALDADGGTGGEMIAVRLLVTFMTYTGILFITGSIRGDEWYGENRLTMIAVITAASCAAGIIDAAFSVKP